MAERKDVLSCLFWMLTFLLYARYVRRPGKGRYLATLACFAAGLMAKPMLVTLPVVLLLLDYWPLNRFSSVRDRTPNILGTSYIKLVKEKIPFFLLSACSSLITIYAQHQGGAMKNLDVVPVGLRIGNSMVAYSRYLLKTFRPHDLALLYPIPASIPLWQILGSALLLCAVSLATIRYRRSHPYLMVGWFWFLVTLLPVIGLIQVGGQSMADRYTYIPLIGIFIIVAWGGNDLLKGWSHSQAALTILGMVVICTMTALTWRQLGYWRNSITLYQHTLAVTSNNYLILNNYGIALAEQGKLDEAIEQYREALQVWPKSANAHINLGAALAQQGRFPEAIEHYQAALSLQPDYALARGNMGRALASLGRKEEAIEQYEQALGLDPGLADVHLNLALLLLKSGRGDDARRHYETVLRLEPYSVKAPNNMGIALAQTGKLEEAAGCFADAVRMDPSSVEAHFNLGVTLARMERREEAIRQFEIVLRLKPDSEAARGWLEKLGRQ